MKRLVKRMTWPVFPVAVYLLLAPCHPGTLSICRACQIEELIDSPMYQNPTLPEVRVEMVLADGRALWAKALERPEAELRCKAAETIAVAHRRGMKGLETLIPALIEALDRPDQHPSVCEAAAQALIALEARSAAPSFLKHAQSGSSVLRALVEPALARWDYQLARALWLERLHDPATAPRLLILAIQGLGTVGEKKASDPVRAIALSPLVNSAIRLEAAQALARLRNEGLEVDAERLAADSSAQGLVNRLIAASILRQHSGERAIQILQRLAADSEPSVAARAVARLLEIDAKLLVPLVAHLLARSDATLRADAVEVLFREAADRRIPLLADRLDDPHVNVRTKARLALQQLAARKELRQEVLAETSRLLATENWRGLEQATILLTKLDHKPAARRYVELLSFKRFEVYMTAAWGLRVLDVPETLPGVTKFVNRQASKIFAPGKLFSAEDDLLDHQLSQLNQFLGRQKYLPADDVLWYFVPKRGGQFGESRAAAVWALGLLHEGKPEPDTVQAVLGRLNDEPRSLPPENVRVRRMAAITLARLKAQTALPSLRTFCPDQKPGLSPLVNASGWAIEQLTGQAMLPATTFKKVQRDWFLTPFE